MDTAIGTFQAEKKADFTPKRGKIKPVDIFSLERRKTDEDTVADLVEALARDGRFLQQIAVRDEGATGYRLISGHHRLEAWKRHFGKLRPIPADVYPPDTPDALIAVLKSEENLVRNELTPAERQAETIRLAAALKRLNGWKPANASFGPGRGGRKWEADSHFTAGPPRARQQGPRARSRREGPHRQARGQHATAGGFGGDR